MPINLSHREVRDLAKNLRELTGREIRHTQILEAIAKAVGRSADSMMHELKNEDVPSVRRQMAGASTDASHMALAAGFSDAPNGRKGSWIMTALERRDPSPARLDVMIEPTGDIRWIDIDPERPLWSIRAIHTANAWSAEKTDTTVASVGSDGVSLPDAIGIAYEFVASRHHLWAKADSMDAEYDLPELNPLATAELHRRSGRDGVGTDTPYNRARTLGFDVMSDDRGRRFLLDQGPIGSSGPRYRLAIDNDHVDGLSAPAAQMIWNLSIMFPDQEGKALRPPVRLSSSLTLDATCSKVDHFRNNTDAYAEVMEEVSAAYSNRKGKTMTPEDSRRIAADAGFEIWDTGGGCKAFAKLLREVATPGDDVARMELMITVDGGCSIDAAPEDCVWGAGINYTDPRGGDSPLDTGNDLYTLSGAILKAVEFERQADRVWAENYDARGIAEHEGFEQEDPRP